MTEFYDVLHNALVGYDTIDNERYDAEFGRDCLRRIRNFLQNHEGDMAILVCVDGKKTSLPRLVQIHKVQPVSVILRYKCYNPQGEFRQYLTTSIGYDSIYSKHNQIKIFGNI